MPELIFNKTGLKLIGVRTIIASIGLSTDATAIISQAFADRLGQAPPTAPPGHSPPKGA